MMRISGNLSQLKIRPNIFCWSTIQQKQFIISARCFFKIKSVKNDIIRSNKKKQKQKQLVCNYLIVFLIAFNIFFLLGLVFLFLLLCMFCELGIHYCFLEVSSFVTSKTSVILKSLFKTRNLLFNFNMESTSQKTHFHKYVDIIFISHFMEKFKCFKLFLCNAMT